MERVIVSFKLAPWEWIVPWWIYHWMSTTNCEAKHTDPWISAPERDPDSGRRSQQPEPVIVLPMPLPVLLSLFIPVFYLDFTFKWAIIVPPQPPFVCFPSFLIVFLYPLWVLNEKIKVAMVTTTKKKERRERFFLNMPWSHNLLIFPTFSIIFIDFLWNCLKKKHRIQTARGNSCKYPWSLRVFLRSKASPRYVVKISWPRQLF